MHFLYTLVFTSVVYASAAFAATIRVGGCDEATSKNIEIDIKVHHEQSAAEVSEQLVFSMINSPLNTHINVIVCIYAFSTLHTSLSKNLEHGLPECPTGIECVFNVECQKYPGCGWCSQRDHTVSLERVLE